MSELQIIEATLQKAARRRRWARALRGLWHGVLIGALVSLLLIIAWHVLPLPLWTLTLAALIPLPCALAGLLIGGWRSPALPEVARWVDGHQHLQERLSTALEVAGDDRAGQWRDLIVTDAATRARDLDVRSLVPFGLPRATRWAVVALALAAGLGFVPEYRSKAYLQKKADAQNIKEIGRQLSDLTRRSLDKRPPVLEPTQKALESVKDIGDLLTKKTLTRSEALKDLASITEKLKNEMKDLAKDPALRKMEEAARSPGGNDSQTAANLQKQIEAMQKQLGAPTGNPDAMDKMRKELDKLKEAAKAMANKDGGAADAEKQKLSESLAALSKQLQQMGLQLPQLDEAIQALANNQTDLVLKDLQEATLDLEKMRDMAKSLQQLQQRAEQMGKDLAEQLKNGQPELAQSTLQKMINQLQSSSLPPEQLQKIMQEVAKAVDPAGNYGNVKEHLQKAGAQMKSGDTQNASQSLQAAAKELEKLMQQMGDAQQLLATLDNLNQASQCIGSCQGWGSKTGNKPGSNPNGKGPGGGVGGWGDPNAQWDGQMSSHWDNSGVDRPDREGRGQTDRGPGELSDALQPTKVKGQFKPGGQMPSVTLKGVSIKGTSKIQYEEAAAAAQSDAQSALSQEKVPRAYQGAVRDYFGELKK